MPPKPFRFAVNLTHATSKEELATNARRVEQLGYSTLIMADHLTEQLAPLPALLAVADATTTLRVGNFVLNNDLRHPVLLAKEAATLDVLSGGRFELGLGAGWKQVEYEQSGIVYDPAPIRIRRLQESIQVLKRLFAEEPASFRGQFYTLNQLNGFPKPLQKPHPPLLIGGGGKRLLSLAAREANIVGLFPTALPDGSSFDFREITPEATLEKLDWIRQAAGERFETLELNINILGAKVTENPSRFIEQGVKLWHVSEEQVPLSMMDP